MIDTSPGLVGVFDIDGTLMRRHPTASEIVAANAVRSFFDSHGTFTVATAQTAEMIMSSGFYAKSVEHGFKRARPMLGHDSDNKRIYLRPESMPERQAFTNPDLIMSLGTGVHIRKKGWFAVDRVFDKELGGESWRTAAQRLFWYAYKSEVDEGRLDPIDPRMFLSILENLDNYEEGITDVQPLEYRLQLEFKGGSFSQNILMKETVKSLLRRTYDGIRYASTLAKGSVEHADIIREFGPLIDNFTISDESSPEKEHGQLYCTPEKALKEHMVNRGLELLFGDRVIDDLLIAGDMPPDLRAGRLSGKAKRAVFLLVGGSPLSSFIQPGTNDRSSLYAGESFEWLLAGMEKTDRAGFGVCRNDDGSERIFINGAMAYPDTLGPETIRACAQDLYGMPVH